MTHYASLFSSDFYRDIHMLGTSSIFYLPLGGIIFRWLGFDSVNPKNFIRLMEEGKNLCIVPGGFEEATITNNDKE